MAAIIMRHGEVTANVNGLFSGGGSDTPLTQRGIETTKFLAQEIKSRFPSVADEKVYYYTSHRKRTIDTAAIIHENFPNKHIFYPNKSLLLAERHGGIYENQPIDLFHKKMEELESQGKDTFFWSEDGCESSYEHRLRVMNWIDRKGVIHYGLKKSDILLIIVCHRYTSQHLRELVFGGKEEPHDHGTAYVYQINDGRLHKEIIDVSQKRISPANNSPVVP